MKRQRTNLAICLNCGHKYFTKWTADTRLPNWQCPACFGVTVILYNEYKKDLTHLREWISLEEAKKFQELYNYAVEHGYIKSKRKEIKFFQLLKDLAHPESSLGAEL